MAGRKKKPYAFKHRLRFDNLDPAGGLATGWYWVVTNLNEDVYECENLRNVLGIYPEEFARTMQNSPEIVTVNSITELCRMGITGEMSCTIKAADAAVIYAPIGEEQKTSFVFDLTKSVKDVARALLTTNILVGSNNIAYRVVPGTIRLKKQKSRTPHLG